MTQDRIDSTKPTEMTLRGWKRSPKPDGALVGFAAVNLPYKGSILEIDDLPVCENNGKAWAAWPGKPIITAEGFAHLAMRLVRGVFLRTRLSVGEDFADTSESAAEAAWWLAAYPEASSASREKMMLRARRWAR